MGRPRKPHFRESDQWWVSMFHGRRVKLANGRENESEALKRFHELMALEAVARPPESPDATVASLCEAFLDWSHRHNESATYEFYRSFLQDFCDTYGLVRVVDLKPYHVTRWLDGHTWNVTTRRCAITAIKRVMNWAAGEELIAGSPLKGVKKPAPQSRQRLLSRDEDQKLSAETDPPFRVVLLALRHTGARPGEIASVHVEHVDLAAGTWTLGKHKTGSKTGKPRVIYLTPCLVTLSRMLLAARLSGPLFLNSRGQPWTPNAIRCRMRRLRTKLKLDKGVVAYAYRHTFTTEGLANGVPIATMAELLGHVDTTMISAHYAHLAQKTDHLRQAAALAARRHQAEGA